MARIPRVEKGNRPSAVSRGNASFEGSIVAPLQGVAGLVDTFAAGEAEESKAEALKLRSALEGIQAIGNEVETGNRTRGFEASLRDRSKTIQDAFINEPDKAIEELEKQARAEATTEINAAPNAEVALNLARTTNHEINQSIAAMFTWAQLRQIQQIRGGVEENLNGIAAKAGHMTSLAAVEQMLDIEGAKNAALLVKVYGKQADDKWLDVRSQATEEYFRLQGDFRPGQVWDELNDPKSLAGRALKPGVRESLRQQTQASIEGRGFAQELDLARAASGDNRKALDLLNVKKLDAETVLKLQQKTEAALELAKVDTSFTPEQRAANVKAVSKQLESLDAIENIRRRGTRYDPVEAATAESAMLAEVNSTIKKMKGSSADLIPLVEQQQRLILSRRRREITDSSFNTMRSNIELALDVASKDEENNTGYWFLIDSAQQQGNEEMNALFARNGRLKNATPEQKINARMMYVRDFTNWVKANNGNTPDDETVKDMVFKAAAYKTGTILKDEE